MAELFESEESLFVEVALAKPVRREFTYAVDPSLVDQIAPGVRVSVPFGRRREVGVVVAVIRECDLPASRVRRIYEVLDQEAVVGQDLLDLTRWLADYYVCAWGEALAAVLPAAMKREGEQRRVTVLKPAEGVGTQELEQLEGKSDKQFRLLRTLLEASGPLVRSEVLKRLALSMSPAQTLVRKGWVIEERVEPATDSLTADLDDGGRVRPEKLSQDQEVSVSAMEVALKDEKGGTFLLHGVTGSGKTEVYLRTIEKALELGQGAIVLVPEIALTPQTVGWFASRFGQVAVMHSRLTDRQRLMMWRRVQSGELRVVVGARSAIFAPVQNLGVIVVDEEHEPSFKQGSTPRYHARDVAVVRAKRCGSVCILGSATPSLESYENARRGRYQLLTLASRVNASSMPEVAIVDMKGEKGNPMISHILRDRIVEAMGRKEQSILFLNRRGFSPTLWCGQCYEVVRCAQCDVAMTYHRGHGRIVCHSCCEERVPPKDCPSCTAPGLKFLGHGSEKVEVVLAKTFPDARIARMDSDTMLRREDYEDTLSAFGRGEIDILVGTQMIAKGLDFPRVTVVGVVSADGALHLPDLRASERTFQLLAQVSGRAGRADLPGRIVIQTHAPEHPAIQHAAKHDYLAFAEEELALRKELLYPPYGRLLRIVLEDPDSGIVEKAAAEFAAALNATLKDTAQTLGPMPAPMAMIRGRHRHHILIKGPLDGGAFGIARNLLVHMMDGRPRPRVTIDVDPVQML
ncbi:MAG: primosomal protein N' (replication factor Y) [Glaciecola sp.]|jgi:primosomal protein N' (replication factor Y)